MNSSSKQRRRERRRNPSAWGSITRLIFRQMGWFLEKGPSSMIELSIREKVQPRTFDQQARKYELQSCHSFLSLYPRREGVSLLSSMGFAARRWGKVARRPKYALINTKKTEMEKRLLLMNSNGPMTNGRPAVGGRVAAATPRLRRGEPPWQEGLPRKSAAPEPDRPGVQPSRAIARRYLLPSRDDKFLRSYH